MQGRTIPLFAVALIGVAGCVVTAQAHVHGMVRLDMAAEEGRMERVLHGAGDNFVGFEHAAQTPEQVAAVRTADARLVALDDLLRIGAEIGSGDPAREPACRPWGNDAGSCRRSVQDGMTVTF